MNNQINMESKKNIKCLSRQLESLRRCLFTLVSPQVSQHRNRRSSRIVHTLAAKLFSTQCVGMTTDRFDSHSMIVIPRIEVIIAKYDF